MKITIASILLEINYIHTNINNANVSPLPRIIYIGVGTE